MAVVRFCNGGFQPQLLSTSATLPFNVRQNVSILTENIQNLQVWDMNQGWFIQPATGTDHVIQHWMMQPAGQEGSAEIGRESPRRNQRTKRREGKNSIVMSSSRLRAFA